MQNSKMVYVQLVGTRWMMADGLADAMGSD